MALDHLQFTDRFGRPLPPKLRDQLVECVISAIAHPKADIDAVIKRARAIARRAADGQIEDVQHYATKALFAVSRKASLKREREPVASQTPRRMEILAGAATEASPSALEYRVLLQQLLSGLPEMDREVFIRHIEGWEHSEIATELGISEPMSWFRLRRAKKKLASQLAHGR
ncbi:MAG: RNA polymerase sigma factor [Bryobacteraceae bacterium]